MLFDALHPDRHDHDEVDLRGVSHGLRVVRASTHDLTQESSCDLDALFGHQFNDFGHVAKVFLIGLETLEDSLYPTGASNHQVLAGFTIRSRSMNGSRFDEIVPPAGTMVA